MMTGPWTPAAGETGSAPRITHFLAGLIAVAVIAHSPPALADDKPAASSQGGVGEEVSVGDVTMVMVERWGPATGSILDGDGEFFLGEEAPITHEDRIWTDRWLDLDADQVLIVTVWSAVNPPAIQVRDEGGTVLPALGFSRIDGGRIATQVEFYPPDDGRFRVLLTSQDRFADLSGYEVDAGVWEVVEEEDEDEAETPDTDGDGGDSDLPFTDFNNPPPVR